MPRIYILSKNRKKLIMKKIITLLAIVTLLFSCGNSNDTSKENSRIKIKESKTNSSIVIYIVEVDSVEYLVNYSGGIIKLEK